MLPLDRNSGNFIHQSKVDGLLVSKPLASVKVTATKSEGVKGDGHQIGLPRGRIVDSSPNRLAVSVTQLGSPKGRPRLTQTQRGHFGFHLR